MEATNPLIEQYELVKEVHYVFDNIEPKIKARIYKIILGVNARYTWEVNYYNRMADEASVYIPSSPFSDNLNGIESRLANYIKRFESAVEWRLNSFF